MLSELLENAMVNSNTLMAKDAKPGGIKHALPDITLFRKIFIARSSQYGNEQRY